MKGSVIKYRIIRKSVKYPRLELWGNELRIIVPKNMDPFRIVRENSSWISRQIEFVRKAGALMDSLELIPRTKRKFRSLVQRLVEEYGKELNVRVNKVFVRKMKSCWGTCSSEKNITINREAQFLPEKLIRYVIYHEICHLIKWRHDEEFNKLIAEKFPDYEDLDLQLQAYWMKIREMNESQNRSKFSWESDQRLSHDAFS